MNLSRTLKKFVNAIISRRFSMMHTHIPAQVVSYDSSTNTCSIQPTVRIFRTDDTDAGDSQLPTLDDIPVQFAGSGNVFLTCPVKVGSYGVYHVAEDDINTWLAAGGIVSPQSVDRFNLDTGFFCPSAPWMFDSSFGTIATDRFSIRTIDGATEISVLENGNIEIKGTEITINSGADYAVQFAALKSGFDALVSDFNSLVGMYNSHIHLTTATIGLGPAVGVISPTTSTGNSSAASVDSSKIESIRVP